MIEGNTAFVIYKANKFFERSKFYKQVGVNHIPQDDIVQAGMLGLVEAVDRYDPEKLNPRTDRPFAFSTYCAWWVLKHINELIVSMHWTTLKPGREDNRAFMYGHMDGQQKTEYIASYMRNPGSDSVRIKSEDADMVWVEVMQAVDQVDFQPEERRIFHVLYGSNPENDRLEDLKQKEIDRIERGMLEKLRAHL